MKPESAPNLILNRMIMHVYSHQVVLLLHTVLYKMAEYGECVQLADLVVSEQYQLYKVGPSIFTLSNSHTGNI